MITPLLGAVIGLLLGSLIKCLADRAPSGESFFSRSRCDHCHHKLTLIDLIPVISFIKQRGRCRYCHKTLTSTLIIYELTAAVIFGFLFFQFLPQTVFISPGIIHIVPIIDLIFISFVATILLICLITDIQTGLIPNRITYPATIIAFVFQIISMLIKIGILYYSLTQTTLGKLLLPPHSDYFTRHALIIVQQYTQNLLAAAGVGLFFYFLIVITRGKGMGGGDLKLGIFIGLCLGIFPTIVALILAFILGSIVGIGLIFLGKKTLKQTIPFGPFMSIGALLAILCGTQIISIYLGMSH